MNTWVTKYWLPFLLITLATALFFEFNTVEKVALDSGFGSSRQVRIDSPTAKTPLRQPLREKQQGSRLAAGQRYRSLEELVNDQRAAGFVRTGYFGKHWPATVTEVATDRHKISFMRSNGTRHTYNKFDGYDMKMVRLKAGANETIVVFRSQQKRR